MLSSHCHTCVGPPSVVALPQFVAGFRAKIINVQKHCNTPYLVLLICNYLAVTDVADLDQNALGQKDEQEVDLSVCVHVCVCV